MKYRVRLDLSFENEADAESLLALARSLSNRATSIHEGEVNEEVAFCELELCRHDEGLPCEKIERVDVRKL